MTKIAEFGSNAAVLHAARERDAAVWRTARQHARENAFLDLSTPERRAWAQSMTCDVTKVCIEALLLA